MFTPHFHRFQPRTIVAVIGLLVLFILTSQALAYVTLEPYGFAVRLNAGQRTTVEMTLSNDANRAVLFQASAELIGNRQGGPQRDNLGDVIRRINLPNANWFGSAWANDMIWVISHANPGQVFAYDMQGQQRVNFQVQLQQGMAIGLAWNGQSFWTAGWNQGPLTNFDVRGNVIRTVNTQWDNGPTGIAWDGEHLWIATYTGGQRCNCKQVNLQGQVLRTVTTNNFANDWISMEYVPDHRDAPLWILENTLGLWQCRIENNNAVPVQTLNLQNNNSFGLAHDGQYLWYQISNQAICIDDGATEFRMLTFNPDEGEIAANSESDIEVLVETENIDPGAYEALICFELSDESQPVIECTAFVTIGRPAATIAGIVTDRATGEAIENVQIALNAYRY
ncbi:MAG: hypothetical protein FJY65_12370, partial [Calditrichaeota bacterium]|nr:hypothetical protein [Calditrichota bacterium]